MRRFLLTALLLTSPSAMHAADVPNSPMQVWSDYDPSKGDFKEEIISEETKDGIINREFYISAYVLGEDNWPAIRAGHIEVLFGTRQQAIQRIG